MRKFWGDVEAVIRESEVIVIVLDARLPEISRNRDIEEIITQRGKKAIFALNKCDLVSDSILEKYKRDLGDRFIPVSVKKHIGIGKLRERISTLIPGSHKVKVSFVGYPNTGKSSIINALVYRKKSIVSPKSGTTRGVHWVSFSGFNILDSPGVIPVDEWDEEKLALIGARDFNKVKNIERTSYYIFNFLNDNHKESLSREYGFDFSDYEDFIVKFAKKKGFLKKGGIADEKKAAISFIKDWQDGKIIVY